MRIFLVSDSKTNINFFPQLEAFLKKKIADAEIESVFVPFPEDIPAAVSGVKAESDLILVFVLYEELDYKIQALLNKLIDLEMRGKTKIVKVIEESEYGTLSEFRLDQEKDKLAEKWGQFILNYLFKPGSFKPKEEPATGPFL